VRDQTRLLCEFGANLFSRSKDISYNKNSLRQHQKQPYAVACGNNLSRDMVTSYDLQPGNEAGLFSKKR